MFKRIFHPIIDVSLYASVEYGKMDSCPIDQTPVQDFNVDPETGRPESDITKMLRAQTKYEQDKLYKELVERKVSDVEMSESDLRHAALYGLPRLAQSPSELADYAESMVRMQQDKAEEKRTKKLDALRRKTEDAILETERKKQEENKND